MPTHESKLRWYHPTPGRFLSAILAWDGVLFLIEQFRWVQKGWPTLIAWASLGTALLVLLLWYILAVVFHRRFQYGIRSLLILTVAVAFLCSWLAVEVKSGRGQEEIANQLNTPINWGKPMVECMWDIPFSLGRYPLDMEWGLTDIFGFGFFHDIWNVGIYNSTKTDSTLELLPGLKRLKVLSIDNSQVSKSGLNQIEKLTQLEKLTFLDTNIALKNLKDLQEALPKCEIVCKFSKNRNKKMEVESP